MNTLSLLTGALVQRLASASVQPQEGTPPQAHLFTLPEAVQSVLTEHLQAADGRAGEHDATGKHAKKAPEGDSASPSLDALMTLLLMPERPVAGEQKLQAALFEHVTPGVLPLQMAQNRVPMQVDTATPKQLAEQVRLAAEALPGLAAADGRTESPRPERPAALRHVAGEKLSHDRPEPAALADHTRFIADDARFLPGKVQPERVIHVDTRAAQWGEALTHMLKENIHFQLGQQQQLSTIRLDPPSLGKLEIAIQLDGGKLTVHIGASQADVCRTLQQCGDALRVQLTQQNFVQVEVNVSPDGQSQSQSQRQRDDRQTPAQIVSAVELDAEETGLKLSDSVLIKV